MESRHVGGHGSAQRLKGFIKPIFFFCRARKRGRSCSFCIYSQKFSALITASLHVLHIFFIFPFSFVPALIPACISFFFFSSPCPYLSFSVTFLFFKGLRSLLQTKEQGGTSGGILRRRRNEHVLMNCTFLSYLLQSTNNFLCTWTIPGTIPTITCIYLLYNNLNTETVTSSRLNGTLSVYGSDGQVK
jgi:hypothetical protein